MINNNDIIKVEAREKYYLYSRNVYLRKTIQMNYIK